MIRNYIYIYSIRFLFSAKISLWVIWVLPRGRFRSSLSLFFFLLPNYSAKSLSLICVGTCLTSYSWTMEKNLGNSPMWSEYTFTVSQVSRDHSLLSIPFVSKNFCPTPLNKSYETFPLIWALSFLSHTPTQFPTSYSSRLLNGATSFLSYLF